jgi:hypothetical protein
VVGLSMVGEEVEDEEDFGGACSEVIIVCFVRSD